MLLVTPFAVDLHIGLALRGVFRTSAGHADLVERGGRMKNFNGSGSLLDATVILRQLISTSSLQWRVAYTTNTPSPDGLMGIRDRRGICRYVDASR